MRLLVLALLLIMVLPKAAHAQCVNPAGSEGDVVFNETYNVPQYCDGSDTWIAMVGSDPSACLPGIASCGGKPDERVVFVTNASMGGGVGGISGADSICQSEAEDANLHGVYFAYLTGSNAGQKGHSTTCRARLHW